MRQALEYAVNNDSKNRGIEKEAKPVAGDRSGAKIINFPALEEFAAESAKKSSTAEEGQNSKITPDSGVPKIQPAAAYSPMVIDIANESAGFQKNNQKTVFWAIMATLLIIGAAAAMYLSGRNDSSEQNNQTPVAETTSDTNSNREASKQSSRMTDKVAETKTKPALSEKHEESENPVVKEESLRTSTDSPNEPVPSIPSRQKKKASETSQENSENLDDPESVDDEEIEPDNTERENENTGRKDKSRPRLKEQPIPDEMTEEEFKKLQRDLKQRRRERRNGRPPY